MANQTSNNKKIIQALNKKLETVSIVRVAEIIGVKHQTLYFHLDPDRAANVNLDILAKIADAITQIEEDKNGKAGELLNQINTGQ